MNLFIERKGIYGNLLWDNTISGNLKTELYLFFRSLFDFVSPFPEGDGLTFSLHREGPVNLNFETRERLFLAIDDFFKKNEITWYTNIISDLEIALNEQLKYQLN